MEYIPDPTRKELRKNIEKINYIIKNNYLKGNNYIKDFSKLKIILLMQPLAISFNLNPTKFEESILKILKISEKIGIKKEEIGIKNHYRDTYEYRFISEYEKIPKDIPFENIKISEKCILLTFSSFSTRSKSNQIISYLHLIEGIDLEDLKRIKNRFIQSRDSNKNIYFPKDLNHFSKKLKKK